MRNIPYNLSVIIPAFNEEARIPATIRRVAEYVEDSFREYEIIVVDDGSTDRTVDAVRSLARDIGRIKLLQNGVNRGKGFSVKQGVQAASGNIILMTDADLSTPIEEIEKLLVWIERDFDVVIGSRGLKESDIVLRQPWYREKMGRIFNVLVSTLVMQGFKDTQCGFKLFRADVAKDVFRRSVVEGFGFDVEVLFVAGKLGFRIKEVPVRWINSPDSRVKVLSAPLRMFVDLLAIRLNWIRGFYTKESIGR